MSKFTMLWEKTLGYLEDVIPSVSYKAFIKDLKPFQADGDTYIFEVDSPYHKQLMKNSYVDHIKSSLSSAYEELNGNTPENINVDFLTQDEIQEKYSKTQAIEEIKFEQIKPAKHSSLNQNYTFDTFVVGESNKFANATAHGVAQSPGNAYNPLFLYGGVGLGKTHLMHAIGNSILLNNPDMKIVYVTSETFTNELINMIAKTNNNNNIDMREQFRNKYRNVDVLMVDDIQFIAGKDITQDEFFHTFNALHEINKQIIISSDRPPNEMKQLEERMRSRFEWGIVADIKIPDYETRVAILLKKSEMMHKENMLPINDSVYHFIAKNQDSNIRTLEGALQKVIAYADIHKKELGITEIDEATARRALGDYFTATKTITPKLITETVCAFYNISEEDIRGTKKSRDIAFPRQVAMYILRSITNYSYKKIAEYFDKKDHTTIMHAEVKIKERQKEDSSFKRDLEDIIAKIKS